MCSRGSNDRDHNGSLWTLPAEMRMYLLVAAMGVFGFLGNRALGLTAVVALLLAAIFDPQTVAGSLRLGATWRVLLHRHSRARCSRTLSDQADAMLGLVVLKYISYNTTAICGCSRGDRLLQFLVRPYRTTVVGLEKFGDPSYGIYRGAGPRSKCCVAISGHDPFAKLSCDGHRRSWRVSVLVFDRTSGAVAQGPNFGSCEVTRLFCAFYHGRQSSHDQDGPMRYRARLLRREQSGGSRSPLRRRRGARARFGGPRAKPATARRPPRVQTSPSAPRCSPSLWSTSRSVQRDRGDRRRELECIRRQRGGRVDLRE